MITIPPGTAYATWIAALEDHGMFGRHYGPDAYRSQCPWKKHRGGGSLPLKITRLADRVWPHCFGGCNDEDIASSLGLLWPSCKYDNPMRKRPTRNDLRYAMRKASGYTHAEREIYHNLLDRADNTTSLIPWRWQPGTERDLAKEIPCSFSTLKRALAHFNAHDALVRGCRREDCDRPWPHALRGHLAWYELEILQSCPGIECEHRWGHKIGAGYRPLSSDSYGPGLNKIGAGFDKKSSSRKEDQAPISTEDIPGKSWALEGRSNGSPVSTRRPGRPRIPERTAALIISMADRGYPQVAIAETVGVSQPGVSKVIRRRAYAIDHALADGDVHDCEVCRRPCHGPIRRCALHGGSDAA